MRIVQEEIEGRQVAYIQADGILLKDMNSALDMISGVWGDAPQAQAIILDKSAICEEFFDLSTRLAGEVLQKLCNYHLKFAIVGDFSGYTSKSLADFIRESNRGRDIFFVSTREEAERMLGNIWRQEA